MLKSSLIQSSTLAIFLLIASACATANDQLSPCEAKGAVFVISPGVRVNAQSHLAPSAVLTGNADINNMALAGFATDAQGRFKVTFAGNPLPDNASYYLRMEVHSSRFLAGGVAGLSTSIKESQVQRQKGAASVVLAGQMLCEHKSTSNRAGIWFDGMPAPAQLFSQSATQAPAQPRPSEPIAITSPTPVAKAAIEREPQLTAQEQRQVESIAMLMMAQMCMGGYPETRPAILKRFRQDIEKVAGKDNAAKLFDARFEEGLKELLANIEPRTIFFSDPPYQICSNYSPETILASDAEKERIQSAADERLHYAQELLEQCKKHYPARTLGAAQDRKKELDRYFGPRRGATEFADPYRPADWLKGSVKNPDFIKTKVAERIKQHGESDWQTRCKPQ